MRRTVVLLCVFLAGCGDDSLTSTPPTEAGPNVSKDVVQEDIGQDLSQPETHSEPVVEAGPDAIEASQDHDTPEPGTEPAPEPQPEGGDANDSSSEEASPEPSPEPASEPSPEPSPEAAAEPAPEPQPEPQIEPMPEAGPDVVDAQDAPEEPAMEAETGPQACPDSANMVRLPAWFCIDKTEVTSEAYGAWLATNPTLAQDSLCSWNTSYVPQCSWPKPFYQQQRPVACVDWCDARDYCQAHGKRLCGKIGGGTLDWGFASISDPTLSEWQNACSAGGLFAYTWGNSFSSATCNIQGAGVGSAWDVGSESACQSQSPGAGLFDLSGNVWEWEDACATKTGQGDNCSARGSSFQTGHGLCGNSAGDGLMNALRLSTDASLGFRCCAD